MDTYEHQPLLGQTYSLYGHDQSTEPYYELISDLADAALRECPDIRELLGRIRRMSRWARFAGGDFRKLLPADMCGGDNPLSVFTPGVRRHLRTMPLKRWLERSLRTTENQYHLYMLEIELVNRLHGEAFRKAQKKIALLPHCLRDFSRECLATDDGLDLVCKGCSKICWMRRMSDLLREHEVTPYIWRNADFKEHYRALHSSGESFGVLGVACIPELAVGMRSCMKLDIPVVGVPLDANRCARWMGDFHENSVNLGRLEKLFHRSPKDSYGETLRRSPSD
jgi:hypothetical protein